MTDSYSNPQSPALMATPEGRQTVILLHGKAGSGKDTVCEMIQNMLYPVSKGTIRLAFADPLKQATSAATGIPLNYFDDRELKESADLTLFGYEGKTPRQLLQFIGTELFRNQLSKDIWRRTLVNKIVTDKEHDQFVITDCRFENELNLIELLPPGYQVLSVKIDRPNNPHAAPEHASEQGLDDKLFDVVLSNDGTLDDLRDKVLSMIKKLFYKEA